MWTVNKKGRNDLRNRLLGIGADILVKYITRSKDREVSSELDEEFAITLQLHELRRKYDKIDTLYNSMRTRMFTLLSIQLAIMAYLFSDLSSLVPNELYGILFFAAGAIGLGISISTLFFYYRSINNWPTPVGPVETEKINNNPTRINALRVVLDDYEVAYDKACHIYSKRAKALNFSLHAFTISAIILLVLKFATV